MSATLPDLSQVGEAVLPLANDLRKFARAVADPIRNVGMASMRRVTVKGRRGRGRDRQTSRRNATLRGRV